MSNRRKFNFLTLAADGNQKSVSAFELRLPNGQMAIAFIPQTGSNPVNQVLNEPEMPGGGAHTKTVKIVSNLQFDWATEDLLVGGELRIPVAAEDAAVLKLILGKHPLGEGRKSYLTTLEIAATVADVWLRKTPPPGGRTIKVHEMSQTKEEIRSNAEYLARRWVSGFNRRLRNRGSSSDGVLNWDAEKEVYRLGAAWHRTKPVINSAEPGLSFRKDPESRRSQRKCRGAESLDEFSGGGAQDGDQADDNSKEREIAESDQDQYSNPDGLDQDSQG